MEIVTYRDMTQLEDPLLQSLSRRERDWWGRLGTGEYVVCSDINCRALQSIDEVYGDDGSTSLEELEEDGPRIPDCPECHGPSELAFPPDITPDFMKYYFSQGVYGALLIDEDEEVQGSAVAFKGTLRDIFGGLNYRQSYDGQEWQQAVAAMLGEKFGGQGIEDAVCWNRLAITNALRGHHFAHRLVKALFDLHPEYDELPTVGDTRFDTKLYPLLRTIGYEDVIPDEHRWITVAHKRCGDIREAVSLSPQEFQDKHGARLAQERQKQKEYIERVNPFAIRRFYRGVPTLKDMIQS